MKKILKRISCFMIVFLLVFTSVLSTLSIGTNKKSSGVITTKADTDSNDRRKALIKMAAGKNANELNKDGSLTLNDEELQVLGVFLSNFYKPFQTCVSSTESETNKKLEEQEIEALISCGFDKDIATALAKAVKKYSSSTAASDDTILYYNPKIKFNSDGKYTDVTKTADNKSLSTTFEGYRTNKEYKWCSSYATFVTAISQGGYFTLKDKKEKVIDFGTGISSFSNENKGTQYNVRVTGNWLPPATALMVNAVYGNMDTKNGHGVAFFNVDNTLVDEKKFDSIMSSLSEANQKRLFVTGSVMHMDCFGNIIADCGSNQYVVVPACMNPYVFQTKGKGDGETLNTYNMVNLQTANIWNNISVEETEKVNKPDGKTKGKVKTVEIKPNDYVKHFFEKRNWSVSIGTDEEEYDGQSWVFSKFSDKKPYLGDFRSAFNDAEGLGFFQQFSVDTMAVNSGGYYASYIGEKKEKLTFNGNFEMPYLPQSRLDTSDENNKAEAAYTGVKVAEHGTEYTSKGNLRPGYVMDYLTIDDLGTYEGDDESGDTIVKGDFASDNNAARGFIPISVSDANNFYAKIQEGNKAFAQNIFLTYVYMFSNYKNNTWDARGVTCKLNLGDSLPKPNAKNVFADIEIDTTQQLLDEGLSLAVLWMHPEKGLKLVAAWVNNKCSAVLTGVHEKILGSNIANNTTATNKYIGFSGYVTMPELNDLSWTSAILEKYNSYSVLIIVIMIILLFGYAMIGRIAPFKIVTTGLIFAFLMALPPVLINGTISITNQFSDRLYGQKFIYWGLVQHENYISEINKAATEGTYEDYLTTLFKQRYAENNSTSSNVSIRLKWMCPKKDNYVQNLKETVKDDTGSAFFSQIVGAMSNSSGITHEDYSESDNKVYLYRSYTDISNWARYTYTAYAGVDDWVEQDVDGVPSISKYTSGNLDDAKKLGFNYKSVNEDPLNRVTPLNCSETIKGFLDEYTSTDAIRKKANLDTFLGIRTDTFKSLSDINNGSADTEDLAITYFSELSESPFYFFAYNLYDQGMNWEDDDATEGFKCLALNESFDNASSTIDEQADETEGDFVAEDGNSNDVVDQDVADTIDSLKDGQSEQESTAAQMGDETNDGYFYNMSQGIVDAGGRGYGEIRDYMDMRTLFTVVVPYLKKCNQMVLDYDKAFGLRTYDGYSYNPEDHENYETKEDKRKFWVNVCTAQMFNLYTPWVDAMYDCKYAKPTSVRVAGDKISVDDPLNPAEYPKERPMIFSESERAYYGVKEAQLTDVEKKIIDVEKNSYERLFQLMNYYTFHDTVITSAAAMIETFEFNKNFSQDSLLSDSYVLYPQAYELKNFSYDAFLRLILSQATGEDIQASASDGSLTDKGGSIYERVVKNSNMFCGIMLVINDAICIWLIPLAKFAFLLLIFAMSIVMLISCIIKIDIANMQATITKSLITPLAKFLLLTIGHSFIVSCFMSEGNTAVTGATSPAITLGDPTMTMILMAIVNGVVIALFMKILLKLIRDTVAYAKAIGQDVIGMAGGVLTMATGAVRNAYNGARGLGRTALGGLFAAGAGLGVGAGIASKVGNKFSKSGVNGSGVGAGSGGSGTGKSSTDGLEKSKSKVKDTKSDEGGSTKNKYDEAIKNSKVKEGATSAVNKGKEVASEAGHKIAEGASKARGKVVDGASKVKQAAGDAHAIHKDKKYKKREEKYNNASPEEKKKMQKRMSASVGRKAFALRCMNKTKDTGSRAVGAVRNTGSKAVGAVKSTGSKAVGAVKNTGSKAIGAVKSTGSTVSSAISSGASRTKAYASGKKRQVKTAIATGRSNLRKNGAEARVRNTRRRKEYNDIVRYRANQPRRKK